MGMTSKDDRFDGRWWRFNELTGRQVHDLLKLRQDIFVVEQNCAFPEIDGQDPVTLHYLVEDAAGRIVGALRAFVPGERESASEARIGRVVIDAGHRGGGNGRKLMRSGIEGLRHLAPGHPIQLSAQAHLESFYASLGFERCSEDYLEDGIPHLDMVLAG